MNIKIRNTLAEITGASIAMIWMWLNLTEAATMTIESFLKSSHRVLEEVLF